MPSRSKVYKFMRNIFLIATAYFISRLVNIAPQILIFPLAHCCAVILTLAVYVMLLIVYLLSKMD